MSEMRREDGLHELRLNMPATHSFGRMARQIVRQFALSEGLPEKEIETLEFVAGELLDNAVDHGGGRGARELADLEGDVRMGMHLDLANNAWAVSVADQGGANPEDVQELIKPSDGFPNLDDERGRGFFLLVGMVDELTVAPSQDGLGLTLKALRIHGEPA
jgi:anti-sigma regulatory factor (Ser/Thr protein kinase)